MNRTELQRAFATLLRTLAHRAESGMLPPWLMLGMSGALHGWTDVADIVSAQDYTERNAKLREEQTAELLPLIRADAEAEFDRLVARRRWRGRVLPRRQARWLEDPRGLESR